MIGRFRELRTRARRIYSTEGLAGLAKKSVAFVTDRVQPRTMYRTLYYSLAPSYGKMAIRDPFEDMSRLLESESPTVVDAGANRGQTVELFKSWFRAPELHAFEPQPIPVETMRERHGSDDRVNIKHKAVGPEPDTISLNVTEDSTNSSVLDPIDRTPQTQDDREEVDDNLNKTITETVSVDQVRIDGVVKRADILKLDLQGYELQALRGATGILDECKIVFTEVVFEEIYEENAMCWEIDRFLRENGFALYNYYELYTRLGGNLSGGDAIYLNTAHFDMETLDVKT